MLPSVPDKKINRWHGNHCDYQEVEREFTTKLESPLGQLDIIMSSKAASALLRLKEIDKKYKSRLDEHKIVGESSSDGSDKESQEILRPRLNIQMPETHAEYVSNYPSDNERKLLSPIRIVNSVLELSNESESRKSNKSNDESLSLRENLNENSAEILEQSISEIFQASNESSETSREIKSSVGMKNNEKVLNFSEFLNNYSNSIDVRNDNYLNKSGSFSSRGGISTEESPVEEIENYSQEAFESNSSSTGENESADETLASEISEYQTADVEMYEETMAETSVIIPEKIEGKSAYCREDEKAAKEIIEMISHLSGQSSNANGKIENAEFESQRGTPSDSKINQKQLVKGSGHEGFDIERKDVKISGADQSGMSNASELSINLGKSISSGDTAKTSERQEKEEINEAEKLKKTEDQRENSQPEIKRDREISSSIKKYVRRFDQETRHLQIFPNHLTFPENSCLRIVRPLGFPKMPEFILSGGRQDPDPDTAYLRSRLIDIRQWLEDQYSFYKEHCDLAASINRNYQADGSFTRKIIGVSERCTVNNISRTPQVKTNDTIRNPKCNSNESR
uniref:Uncharacterized protein n=1 Tax=Fopius arisanus TaxID=64838 RepID=A0A0C9R8W8_9HYME